MENNSTDNTIETIKEWIKHYPNTTLIRLWFIENTTKFLNNPYSVIGIARQLLLQKARKLSVDYAIFVDDDIFLSDTNFIDRIINHKKDLVGGAYYRHYDVGKFLSYLDFNKGNNKVSHPYILRNYIRNKLFKVAATSGGCLCLSKKVLMDKRLNFYPIPDYYGKGKAGEDFAFCETARRNGYTVWVNDSFRLCHYQIHEARPWREKKEVINEQI